MTETPRIKKFKVKTLSFRSGVVREHIVTVDEEDAFLLRGSYWHVRKGKLDKHCYVIRTRNGEEETLGHVILRAPVGQRVFHINGDSMDNRRCNLFTGDDRIEEIE